MKMTKKLFLVAIATAAFALTSCGMGDFSQGIKPKEKGTKYDKVFTVENKATEGEKFQRGMKQLGAKETVQSIQTKVTVWTDGIDGYVVATDNEEKPWKVATATTEGAKQVKGVVGLIFDWHQTKVNKQQAAAEGAEAGKYYDFILIGYQPTEKKYYIERYFNVNSDIFSKPTSDGVWGDAGLTAYITPTNNTAYYTPANTDFVTEGTDDDGAAIQELTITVKQETAGVYTIELGDGKVWTYEIPEDEKDSYNDRKTGKRIGGAGYYVNCPLGLTVKGNFDSKNDVTVGLEEEVDE